MFFTEMIEEMLSYYDQLMKKYKSMLAVLPEGSLISQKNGKYEEFLRLYSQNGKRIRQGINRNQEMIRALAQKEFARKSLQVLEPNVQLLQHALGNLKPFDPGEIIRSMTKGYSKLPEEYFFDRNQLVIDLKLDDEIKARIDRHREWGAQPYRQSTYKEENKRIRTSRGLAVRSKSEALIIESLYRWHDIPHRYEQEKVVNGILINPDITLEDYNRDEFYIEHLGMMDNPGYARHNFEKLERYYGAGLIPGDNLILTFDRKGTINMRMIEAVIVNEIIPRL